MDALAKELAALAPKKPALALNHAVKADNPNNLIHAMKIGLPQR